METEILFCEVIGCGDRATWELITEGDPLREEFLCDRHWNEMRSRVPDYSLCYIPLGTSTAALSLKDEMASEC